MGRPHVLAPLCPPGVPHGKTESGGIVLHHAGARAPRGGLTRQGVVLTDLQSLLIVNKTSLSLSPSLSPFSLGKQQRVTRALVDMCDLPPHGPCSAAVPYQRLFCTLSISNERDRYCVSACLLYCRKVLQKEVIRQLLVLLLTPVINVALGIALWKVSALVNVVCRVTIESTVQNSLLGIRHGIVVV